MHIRISINRSERWRASDHIRHSWRISHSRRTHASLGPPQPIQFQLLEVREVADEANHVAD